MKRSLIVGAIAMLATGAALAQSSVTIFGRVNTTVESQKNIAVDGKQVVMQDNASRLGFKGTEDLGGGLSANFYLEHRFSSDTGTVPGAFWAGDSWAGLAGGFGTVRLGRLISAAYYATADYISMHNHDTGTSADVLYTYLSGSGSNTVSYMTPEIAGFTLEGTVAAGEGVDAAKVYNLALNGKFGAFAIGAGYELAPELDNQQFAIRGLAEFGPVTVGAYYQLSELETGPGGLDVGKRNAFRLSAMYTMGASEIHANYGWADDWDDLDDSKAQQFTIGYNYNLSKRTKVYAFYTKVDNGGALSYFGATSAGGEVLDPSSLAIGVRHNF
jgi:predicted porin